MILLDNIYLQLVESLCEDKYSLDHSSRGYKKFKLHVTTHTASFPALECCTLKGMVHTHNVLGRTNYALGRVQHTVVQTMKTSLSGFDLTMWLQHLVLVPQMCSDRP